MAFADYDYAKIPIGQPLLQQPLRSTRTDLDGSGESFACRPGLLCRGPTKAVDPLWGGVFPEQVCDLLMQTSRPSRRWNTGIVRCPRSKAADIRCQRKLKIREVKNHSFGCEVGKIRTNAAVVLGCSVGMSVERNRRPAAAIAGANA